MKGTITLIGMMGAGKSAVGAELARQLTVPFHDSDTEIERAAAMRVAEIFARDGEAFFRAREAEIIARIATLAEARLLTRVGVIVRHRALGWRANAMVVWQLPDAAIDPAGRALARVPGVTLCYHRRVVPGVWDWPLFCMIHARSRREALSVLDAARALPELAGVTHKILFSTRCFKQQGALIDGGAT